jgi:hypothetical protein
MISCSAFMHGYTWRNAMGSYHLVTGDKHNFGDKRIKYNKSFHNYSALSNFLDCKCNTKGKPDFIYEYYSAAQCRGIQLFYIQADSVFVFEEPQKGKLQSIFIEGRKISISERNAYEKLIRN